MLVTVPTLRRKVLAHGVAQGRWLISDACVWGDQCWERASVKRRDPSWREKQKYGHRGEPGLSLTQCSPSFFLGHHYLCWMGLSGEQCLRTALESREGDFHPGPPRLLRGLGKPASLLCAAVCSSQKMAIVVLLFQSTEENWDSAGNVLSIMPDIPYINVKS